jgi:GxxExxY protein
VLEERLTNQIIRAFYYVYDRLGYGFVESVYQRSLAHVLRKRNLHVEREAGVDVWFDDVKVGYFRADMIVERRIVIEIKASQSLADADWKQLLNYLRATNLEVGLLVQFGPRPTFKRLVYSNTTKATRLIPNK